MPNNLVLAGAASKGGSTKAVRAASRQSASASSVVSGGSAVASRTGLLLGGGTAFGTLVFGKMSRVFAAFVSFHYLQDRVALPLYLFFVGAGASLVLLALQRPWNGRRIGQRRARKIVLAGAVLALTLYVWTAGLRSAGPLRTLLIDGAELPLLYLFAVASRRELPERRRTRGAALMLAAYALLIWDASGRAPDLNELERTRIGQTAGLTLQHLSYKKPIVDVAGGEQAADARHQTRKLHALTFVRRRLLGTYKPPVPGSGRIRDAFVEGTPLRSEIGVVLVLIASVIMQSSRAFTRRLATELGGAKRHFALSLTCATVWLAPLALLSSISSAGGALLSLSVVGGITHMRVSFAHALGFATVGFLWLVVPYYVRAIVSTQLSQRSMLQYGVVIPFLMAAAVSIVLGAARSAGGVSWILITAFVLDAVGISLMMSPGAKRALSELPLDSGNTTVEPRSTTSTQ